MLRPSCSLAWAASLATLLATADANAQGWSVPATFRDARIFVSARPMVGPPIVFYTDSGGGFNAIAVETAAKLKLEDAGSADDGRGKKAPLVAFPRFAEHDGVPRAKNDKTFGGNLVAVPLARLAPMFGDGVQGFLGSRWFANRIWELDYVRGTMRVLTVAKPADPSHRVALGFQQDPDGGRNNDFARITVTIDGEPLDLLFDTGATVRLTASSAPIFGRTAGTDVGGAFITKSAFDRWVARHPDWRVIASGDALGPVPLPMIEVPAVTIAGLTVGPVWFAERPDANFRDMMSSMMDKPIVGALGGSALRHVRVTIDYPGAVAWFETPTVAR